LLNFKPYSKIRGGFIGRSPKAPLNEQKENQNFFHLKQIHSDKIVFLEKPLPRAQVLKISGDALITHLPSIPIAVKTADCVSVLLALPQGPIAVVHAGWRGTLAKILSKTLKKIAAKYQSDHSQTRLAMGPAICMQCYEVEIDVAGPFQKKFPGKYVQIREKNKFGLDLKKANIQQAVEEGVLLENIEICPQCTLCEQSKFFSHRGAQAQGISNEGRNYAWLILDP